MPLNIYYHGTAKFCHICFFNTFFGNTFLLNLILHILYLGATLTVKFSPNMINLTVTVFVFHM